ncbi:MAG: DNA alkylation repair protein [Zavarzinella sp.]
MKKKANSAEVQEILTQLKARTNEKTYAHNKKDGAGENQFGVPLGEIRKLAKELKLSHEQALSLWATGNLEARLLAILAMKPKSLSAKELDQMIREANQVQVADWFNAYVVKNHPDKDTFRESWMDDADPWAARAGWALTSSLIVKDSSELDLPALLDRLEAEMATAPPMVQWTMNFCLGHIGIHHAQYRTRALAIGEKLGLYRDYPVSKGCTPPYVPIWVNEMVKRAEK